MSLNIARLTVVGNPSTPRQRLPETVTCSFCFTLFSCLRTFNVSILFVSMGNRLSSLSIGWYTMPMFSWSITSLTIFSSRLHCKHLGHLALHVTLKIRFLVWHLLARRLKKTQKIIPINYYVDSGHTHSCILSSSYKCSYQNKAVDATTAV